MELCATRQQCRQECVLTHYLPANKPEKYACLMKVFGMKRLVRYLSEIDPSQRQACVASLCFEAEARIRDPVHGCAGIIHRLQRRLQHLQLSLKIARRELAKIEHEQNHRHLVIRPRL